MRDQRYCGNRDLVTWGVLVRLAESFRARHILQVLYYRPADLGDLDLGGEKAPFPDIVAAHFREASDLRRIECGAKVEVIAPAAGAAEHQRSVVEGIQSRGETPGIVFLDLSGGLDPSSGIQHVRNDDLVEIWRQLRAGDVLALSQHQTNRNGSPWVEARRGQFERALGIEPGTVRVARAERIATDVVVLYLPKPSPPSE